ncbi:MAG TPA: mechanosensitive ion channel family protein [Candidatus Saccharimonadales bacterium]|nr:mechanosensitive ion channel family protein [Candidatus Saccharimonadales bacterium]
MDRLFAASQLDNALGQGKDMLERFTSTFLSGRSILTFIIAMGAAIVLGRLVAAVMRRFARALSRRADKADSVQEVNRLRRIETFTVLSVALIRMVLVAIALYFWWIYAHPSQQPTALISATALVVVVCGATLGPLLRDLAYGGVMMAEHWFGVGDYVKVEPFGELEGIVDRVTLRSIRIRGINGEVIWLNNQNIQGVRVSPKGVRTIGIDMFVTDLNRGLGIVEQTNLRLPAGPLMVVRPLHIMSQNKVGEKMWHIIAIGETAPGREWLLKEYAIRVMNEMDEPNKRKVLATEPISRYADSDAERRFARTIQNARKSSLHKRHFPLPEALANQIGKPLAKKTTDSTQKRTRKIQ